MISSHLAKTGLETAQVKSLLDAAGNVASAEMGRSVLAFAAKQSANKDMRKLALSNVFANLGDNWEALAKDPATLDSFKALLQDAAFRPMMLDGIGSLGLSQFTGDVAAVASAPGTDLAERKQAIRVLVGLNGKDAAKTIRTLLADQDAAVRQAALDALVDLQDVKTLREILTSEGYSLETRRDAATRLLDSSGGALVLLQLVKANELTADLKQEVVRVVTHHPDTNVRLLFEEFIPEAERPKKLGAAIKAEEILALKGDAGQGEKIFRQSAAAQCKSCHVVHGVGGNVGPDLSTIGTKYERAALLETILEPSKAISHEYRPYVLETVRGQVFNGIVESRNKKFLTLKDVKGKLMRIPAKDIELLTETSKSLMPELILQDISAQDAADLLAYLTTLKQKTNVVGSAR